MELEEEAEEPVEEVVEEDILDYLREVLLRQMPSSWVVEVVDPLVILARVAMVVETKEMLVLMEEEQEVVELKPQVVLEKEILGLDLRYKVEVVIMLVQVVVEQAILGLQQHQQKQTLDQVVVEEDMHHINQIPMVEQVVLVSSSSHIPLDKKCPP